MDKNEVKSIAFKLGLGMAKEGMIGVLEYCKLFPWNNKKAIDKEILELKKELRR